MLFAAAAAGVPSTTVRTVVSLVTHPLWFLVPYLLLRAATPVVERAGLWLAGPAVAVVAGAGQVPDWPVAGLGGLGLSQVVHYVAVPAAWLVPWWLGIVVARGRLGGWRTGAVLAGGGAATVALLIVSGQCAASAVGVPGDGRSNLDPPSLAAVAWAVAQVGGFLLVRPLAERPWRAVARLNRIALPAYLGHQSVLVLTAGAAVALGLPGLVGAPGGPGWIAARVAWLPILALLLVTVARRRT